MSKEWECMQRDKTLLYNKETLGDGYFHDQNENPEKRQLDISQDTPLFPALSPTRQIAKIAYYKSISPNQNSMAAAEDLCEVKNKSKETNSDLSPVGRKSTIVLILGIFSFFLEGCAVSLMGPFYPKEAEEKGVSVLLSFIIFSIFEIVKFISSPLFGKYLVILGPKLVLLSGVVVGGICTIIFGTLESVTSSATTFTVLSFAFRSLEALGYSGFTTALSAITTNLFSNNLATTFSYLETANGVGLTIGPAIGGVIYELGGFGSPFYLVGALVLLNGCFMYVIIPVSKEDCRERTISMLKVIRHPKVFVALLTMVTGSMADSFMEPTLSPYMEPFGFSTAVVGLFFVLYGGLYTVTCPFFGFLSDRQGLQNQLIIAGHLVTAIGFLLMGSQGLFPLIPFNLGIIITGLALTGISLGCMSIPTVKCCVMGVEEIGYEHNTESLAVISGLSSSVYCLGAFLGPMAGGVLVTQVGYPMAYASMGMLHVGMTVVTFLFFICHKNKPTLEASALSCQTQ